MTKRQYINLVRQYVELAKRKSQSFSEAVLGLHDLYIGSCRSAGYSEAELDKERSWSEDFLRREYGKADAQFEI